MSVAASLLEPLCRRVFATAPASDAALLDRFGATRDPEAFRALVERHGPLVLGVARRITGNFHADDVFQATFLTLARKAMAVRRPDALAVWLHHTAYRLSLDAMRAEKRRRAAERRRLAPSARNPLDELSAREFLAVLDAEIERLPESDRAPLILCCLDGLSLDEAASRLGTSRDAVKGRLERSRLRLRRALARRGFTASVALGAGLLLAPSAVARPLIDTTISLCLGGGTAVPAAVAALLVAAPRPRLWAALLLGVMGIGVGLIAVAKRPAPVQPPSDKAPVPAQRVDRFGDPLPDGAVMRLGTVGFRVPRASGVGFRQTGELVAVSETLDMYVWPADGTPKPTVTKLMNVPYAARGPVVSPDARFAAVQVGRRLIVWDLSGKAPTEYFSRDTEQIQKLCFSPDGARLAVQADGDRLGTLHLCDLTTKSWHDLPFHGRYAESLSFSHDGKSLVVLVGQNISVINVATRKERCQIQGPRMNLAFAALSPDGTILALQPTTFIHGPERPVQFLSVPDGKPVERKRTPTGSARWVAFSPDGQDLLMGGPQGIRNWYLATGRLEHEVVGPAEHPPVYSADGRRYATYGSNAVLLVDATCGKPVRPDLIEAGHAGAVAGIRVSPDGKRIATWGMDSEIRLWAADTGRPVCRLRAQWGNDRRVAFLPDSQSFVAVAEDYVTPVVRDTSTGRELRRFTIPADMAKTEVTTDLQVSTDGKLLTTHSEFNIASAKAAIVRWDIATGKLIERTEAVSTRNAMEGNAYSPDGRWLIQYGKLTRVGTGFAVQLTPARESGGFTQPIFSDDERLLAVTRTPRDGQRIDWDRSSAIVVDLMAGAKITEIATGRPLKYAISPDGRRLAVAGLEYSTVWDLRSGKLVGRYPASGVVARTNAITFTPDGRRLITGHYDCTALIWDLPALQSAAPLTEVECKSAWADLASSDAGKGFAAVGRLSDDSKQSLPFLKEHLRPIAPPPAAEVQALLADLGSPQFKSRDAAEKALRSHGERVASMLRDALKTNPPAEAKKRIETIVASFADSAVPEGEALRGLRAVWALERIDTPEARRLLADLATGVDSARLTREAKAALERAKN